MGLNKELISKKFSIQVFFERSEKFIEILVLRLKPSNGKVLETQTIIEARMLDERSYWLGFSVFPGIGPATFKKLLKHFGTGGNAWKADKKDLKNVLGEKLLIDFESFRIKFSIAEYEQRLGKKNVWYLTALDKEYPPLLLKIDKSPIILFGIGALKLRDEKTIAVVGTRRITQYGREVTEIITSDLVRAGFTIISGLALGVDALAHKSAIDNNGRTIAVLGCGVDCCSPEENLYLYDDIVKTGGTIISELPLGHPPTKGSFPSRNRIVAGLSLGVLVTEGAEDSGALITADYALKFARKVFAVPGPITSTLSKGPYKLIQKGAKLVTSAEDILQELKFEYRNPPASTQRGEKFETNHKSQIPKFKTENKEENLIIWILRVEPLSFDEIVRRSKMESSKVGGLLSMMEIKGMIKSSGSGTFSITR